MTKNVLDFLWKQDGFILIIGWTTFLSILQTKKPSIGRLFGIGLRDLIFQ